jgi:hypothetical protein
VTDTLIGVYRLPDSRQERASRQQTQVARMAERGERGPPQLTLQLQQHAPQSTVAGISGAPVIGGGVDVWELLRVSSSKEQEFKSGV